MRLKVQCFALYLFIIDNRAIKEFLFISFLYLTFLELCLIVINWNELICCLKYLGRYCSPIPIFCIYSIMSKKHIRLTDSSIVAFQPPALETALEQQISKLVFNFLKINPFYFADVGKNTCNLENIMYCKYFDLV